MNPAQETRRTTVSARLTDGVGPATIRGRAGLGRPTRHGRPGRVAYDRDEPLEEIRGTGVK